MSARRFAAPAIALFLAAGFWTPLASKSPATPTNSAKQSKKTKGKTSQPTVDPTTLVWPGPPEQPRVRFVAEITGESDVRGPVKLSWMDRLAGRKPARNQLRLSRPYGVVADRAGRVYVADGAVSGVVIFDRANKETGVWRGNGQFPLLRPMGLALDSDERLFVADSYGGQVVVFSPDGLPVAGFGQGTLGRPGGLAIDTARNRLYVPDAKLNQVFVFDAVTFELQRTIGTKWTGKPTSVTDEMLSAPTNVAVDAQGSVYVVDTFNCRVQVFDSDGRFRRSLGGQGAEPGHFIRPRGIAIDSQGHVYVADAAFNNFQILTPEGKPLMFVGAAGDQPGQFLLPAGMSIDSQDRVYVTEQRLDGGRLQIFQYIADPEIVGSRK